MGLYTSIIFAPDDRLWTGPPTFIREIAALLEVDRFDHHSVYRRQPFWKLPFLDVNNRDIQVSAMHGIEIESGIAEQRVGSRYWTHFMFPYGDFMKRLSSSITARIPEEIFGRYCPWDSSINNGHWEAFNYDTGKRDGHGRFSLVMSADECPPDLGRYLEHFTSCPEIQNFIRTLSTLTGKSWTTSINLT